MNKAIKAAALATICLVGVEANTDCTLASIHGAFVGVFDVTNNVAHMYNNGEREFANDVTMWGDMIKGDETFSIVYEKCGNVAVATAFNGEKISLP